MNLLSRTTGYRIKKAVALALMTTLLFFVPDADIHPNKPSYNAYAQTSTATCQKLPIATVTASSNSFLAGNVLDNNFNTRWGVSGSGAWIQADLGSNMNICDVKIAWYLGNLVSYNFIISVSADGRTFTNVFNGKSSGTTVSFETYTLPGGSQVTGRYVRITVNGNNFSPFGGITELSIDGPSNTAGPPPPPPQLLLYDNFEGGTYTLLDGQTSPNGKWYDNFNGYGSAGVQDDGTGNNNVFFEIPATSTSPSETHASSVSSTQKFSNFELDIDAKTLQQLRQNSPPNPWEAATVFFRQTDTFHFYAFVLKTNGIEFDKKRLQYMY